jgi:hypothetical protein
MGWTVVLLRHVRVAQIVAVSGGLGRGQFSCWRDKLSAQRLERKPAVDPASYARGCTESGQCFEGRRLEPEAGSARSRDWAPAPLRPLSQGMQPVIQGCSKG